MLSFDLRSSLQGLLHVEDRMSMAHSIESRVPFLTKKIVEFESKIPLNIKLKNLGSKNLVKNTFSKELPQSIMNRTDKMGFPVPIQNWMNEKKFKSFINDTLLSERSLSRGIYRPSALRRIANSEGVAGRELWGALSLELWHQINVDL